MKKNLAEIVCIVDRSGSMRSIQDDVIGGFNTFIEEQKKLAGEANATLVLFDHEYNEVYAGKSLDCVEPLNEETYQPRGMTAYLDAVGRTITTIGSRLNKLKESEKPEKVIFTIITDGQENSSKEYNKSTIAEMIKLQQDNYSWEFLFIGANMDVVGEATSLNIPIYNAIKYASTSKGTRNMYQTLSCNVSAMRSSTK